MKNGGSISVPRKREPPSPYGLDGPPSIFYIPPSYHRSLPGHPQRTPAPCLVYLLRTVAPHSVWVRSTPPHIIFYRLPYLPLIFTSHVFSHRCHILLPSHRQNAPRINLWLCGGKSCGAFRTQKTCDDQKLPRPHLFVAPNILCSLYCL